MKKLLAILLVLAMVLGLVACGSGSSSSETETSESAASEESSAEESSTEEAASEESSEETAAAEESESETTTADMDVATVATVNESGEPVYGGTATVLYGDDLIQYFDPAMGDNRTYSIWLETLFAYDWSQEDASHGASMYVNYTYYSGQIADSYEVDYDASTITVTIRDDVYFQDKVAAGFDEEYDIFGARQLTAEDVAYSYRRLLGIDGVTATANTEMPWDSLLPAIESIEVVDDTTLIFNIPGLTEVQLDTFITTPVNITGAEWDELTTDQQNDWHYAVGTGPYILTDFQLNASMSYVASTNYYDYDERYPENKLPYLDTVKFVEIEDSANILSQFISGQLDIISFGNDVMSSSEMQNLRDTLGEGGYQEVDYKTAPLSIGTHFNLDSPMSDLNVRLAMQHAIDYKTITQAVYGISADEVTLWGAWAEYNGWGTDATEKELEAGNYDYDPELAISLLTEAGYPDGFEFTYYMKNDSDLSTVAQMVSNYLAQVGITMNIEICADTSELNQHCTDSTEWCVFGGATAQFSLKFASMQIFPGGPSYSLFIDDLEPDYVTACSGMTSATSLEEQSEYAATIDEILVTNHYMIYTSGCGEIHQFYSAKLGGVTGEQFCTNNMTRTMIARLWSTTGE